MKAAARQMHTGNNIQLFKGERGSASSCWIALPLFCRYILLGEHYGKFSDILIPVNAQE